jgi:ribosomal subunit interface protein
VKIRIQSRDVELTERLRLHVGRRLGLSLGRFGERIDKVSVHFTRTDAPSGGSESHCRIDVDLNPRHLRADDADPDLFAAVDGATDRVSRSVARVLERDGEGTEMVPLAARGSKP